jgi:hypothetical protein
MTKDQQIQTLKHCFEETIWMAIRYAHGRHTYAPSTVRDAIKHFQSGNTDWKPSEDKTLHKPSEELSETPFASFDDYLNDLTQ